MFCHLHFNVLKKISPEFYKYKNNNVVWSDTGELGTCVTDRQSALKTAALRGCTQVGTACVSS